LAKEKLKEAKAVSGMDVATFVDYEPYKNKDIVNTLKDNLKAISI
jgi:hypothetical protein